MKSVLIFFLVFIVSMVEAQSLPIDFEEDIKSSDFIDFDGGKASVINNIHKSSYNPSNKVAQIIRSGGQLWAGSKLVLKSNLNFSQNSIISMKVFTTAPAGTTIKFKLEGSGATERDIVTKVSNEWETHTWDFTGVPALYDNIVFMFDFGKLGDGGEKSTFLFDDIEQLYSGKQIGLPVNFEDSLINYTMTDFGGNKSSLVIDPNDTENNVIKVVKTLIAATWAGTTIGTQAGFDKNIPLTLTNSKMNVRIWSPDAGIQVRLKVEDWKDPTHTCETQTKTTLSGKWENIEFDFKNQAQGTELLSVGLNKGWTYNKASIFFNFGKEGAEAGEKTYYFDDVQFGPAVSNIKYLDQAKEFIVFPNPSQSEWTIHSDNALISTIKLVNLNGDCLYTNEVKDKKCTIDGQNLPNGVYMVILWTEVGVSTLKLVK